jgi:hypothetical protein
VEGLAAVTIIVMADCSATTVIVEIRLVRIKLIATVLRTVHQIIVEGLAAVTIIAREVFIATKVSAEIRPVQVRLTVLVQEPLYLPLHPLPQGQQNQPLLRLFPIPEPIGRLSSGQEWEYL